MKTLEEKLRETQEKTKHLERQRRIELRQEREAQKKINQRRNFIIGEMVSKKFPKVLQFMPGTKVENKITFAPLGAFLEVLSDDTDLVKELSARAAIRAEGSNGTVAEID